MEDDLNVAELAAAVAGDIFPETPPIDPPEQESAPVASHVIPPIEPPPEEIPLPKAWKKEMETHWKTLPPDVRKYIQTRESDVVKGFDQYSVGHKNWSKLLEPYAPVLQQHPNVDPVQLLQSLMNSHLRLLQTPVEQRKALGVSLLKQYGVDLETSVEQTPPQQLPPELQRALGEVGTLKTGLQTLQQTIQQQQIAEQAKVVQAFSADPKNEYFEEVGDDILRLLKTGAAETLESAYETAIWANPVTRQKLLAKQQAAVKPVAKPPRNVDGSGEGTPRGQKPATMDDTINAVIAKHYGNSTH
jgi:chaperonin cofactor prefoldin